MSWRQFRTLVRGLSPGSRLSQAAEPETTDADDEQMAAAFFSDMMGGIA